MKQCLLTKKKDTTEILNICVSVIISNSDPSVVHPVASRYTDCATAAPKTVKGV
jgi:hypothetical protein